MDFTFGVVTYNSEEFVLETLESIRYQVEQYGKEHRTTLIVSDDASTDNTVEMVNRWIEKYGGLFARTQVMTVEKNTGVAHNVARILRNITDDCVRVTAGDDLISSFNAYEQAKKENAGNMNIYAPMLIKDGNVYVDEKNCINMFYLKDKKHTNKKDIHLYEIKKPFFTPDMFLRRRFYTEECLNVMEQYTQFEDNSSEYYILTHNPEMVFDFIAEPVVLYRIHGGSLTSGGPSFHQLQFLDDLHRLNKFMLKDEKNPVYKFVIFLYTIFTFRMKHRFGIEHTMYGRLISAVMKKREKSVKKNPEYATFVSMLNKQAENEAEFYHKMKNRAEEFEREVLAQTD
jgi:glycosyltransferase involved in cell wall biosynthesis